ncbi:histidinol-phosphate transaminase [Asaia sp. W19]|uniref:histidinol-phosphate transaminase n=1 Tax=unclassified Asaia TaxID=2685023 RepID=UPI000F8C6EFF|nr:histidinol-phosphate transaminase [Asaia sp. W19]RUT26432.1 histidinol-phosphate transaminase [Asaia sp. W19]
MSSCSSEHTPLFRCRPEIESLPVYNAGLAADMVRERYGIDRIVKLGSNENPHGPPPGISEALSTLLDRIALYPESESRLREALAAFLDQDPASLVFGNGSEQLIRMIMQGAVSPGDRVVTVLPSFGLHILNAEVMGARVEAIPVTQDAQFDLSALIEAVSRPTRMLILSNPSNPVGCMMTAGALAELIAACPEDCLLVIDEAYREYAQHDPTYPDARTVLRAQSRPWIVLGTFSKAWGLAGLRIGYAMTSSPDVTQALEAVRDPFNTNIAAQIAAIAALKGQDHMRDSVARTVAERERVRAALAPVVAEIAPSCANFLFFRLSYDADRVAEHLLTQGVIVKPWKESGFRNRIRVSIGLPEDNDRFLAALKNTLIALAATARDTGEIVA